MPALLLRAIVTGFGYKIGAELGRFVAEKVGLNKKDDNDKADEETGYPNGMEGRPDQDPEDPGGPGDPDPDSGAEEPAQA
ncbi:MAG: hypothetical protein ACE37F_10235 [Nannocystaceae bacterium]|nr:hypothetical protein [bacterium]